ncbi:conserved hypothetical protein [Frankia canadensis]|uniref:MaoC-like domain-containing protein n=1 Tax=Frankia canadensis TaxID=1836972 RepID=A0A2I2KY36_9ACTN|nr:MaoC family dehydratase [Frankia canadensis]SNQ50575.1 conserved hypothetical protein [Frankia canadensis]SOU57865.1 conserved hypothetical protein [Frankia canadensis]
MTGTAATEVGQELPTRITTNIRDDDIRLVALILRDSNPIHFDLDAVARAGLGDRAVNQGGATMAYIMNHLIEWAGARSAVRRITCSFRGNVVAGDDVAVGGTVTSVEPTEGGVLAGCDVWADVVGGRRAIAGTATVFLPAAGNGTGAESPTT